MKNKYPTTKEFVEYFQKHPPTDNAKKMLTVHYLAPESTLTAGQFSRLMGWAPNQSSANNHYGKLAEKVALGMNYSVPETKVEFLVSFFWPEEGKNEGLCHWKMNTRLAAAINELGWGTDQRLEDIREDIGFDPLTEATEFTGSMMGVSEGRRKLRQHFVRERNPQIIKIAKQLAKKKNGELRCDACGFSFAEKYGERVSDYIEGHHKLSVSSMKHSDKTKVEDIALLCSNCHRTIHAKYPYISVDELKRLINKEK